MAVETDTTLVEPAVETQVDELENSVVETKVPADGSGNTTKAPDGDTTETKTVVNLGPSLDIQSVGDLHEKLKGMLSSAESIQFDGSEIEKADTAGLQLLTAFCKYAGSQGISVEWKQSSDTLQKSAALLGLFDELHL